MKYIAGVKIYDHLKNVNMELCILSGNIVFYPLTTAQKIEFEKFVEKLQNTHNFNTDNVAELLYMNATDFKGGIAFYDGYEDIELPDFLSSVNYFAQIDMSETLDNYGFKSINTDKPNLLPFDKEFPVCDYIYRIIFREDVDCKYSIPITDKQTFDESKLLIHFNKYNIGGGCEDLITKLTYDGEECENLGAVQPPNDIDLLTDLYPSSLHNWE